MIKKRVIPTLLYKNYTLVKGAGFNSWRRVGSVMQSIKVYNMRQVDELVFFDITATEEDRCPDFDLVDDFADECFMPLTVGGGIKSLDDIKNLLRCGADKVSLNSIAVKKPEIVKQASNKFGSQCIVCAIDYKKSVDKKCEVFINSSKEATGLDLFEYVKKIESLGAGEIILTSIDRDGVMGGYDIEVIDKVSKLVNIPVIASGGAGELSHFLEVFEKTEAHAVAAASVYHFTQITPLEVKKYLDENNVVVRKYD